MMTSEICKNNVYKDNMDSSDYLFLLFNEKRD